MITKRNLVKIENYIILYQRVRYIEKSNRVWISFEISACHVVANLCGFKCLKMSNRLKLVHKFVNSFVPI